jgi:hypothetical protein
MVWSEALPEWMPLLDARDMLDLGEEDGKALPTSCAPQAVSCICGWSLAPVGGLGSCRSCGDARLCAGHPLAFSPVVPHGDPVHAVPWGVSRVFSHVFAPFGLTESGAGR